MKILLISCSKNAYNRSLELEKCLENNPDYEIISGVKCQGLPHISMTESLGEFVKTWFFKVDGIVFFSAVGIAVRSIAPCLAHKSQDPGVVVMDEQGNYCISLLSGHMGGGNHLAEMVAEWMNAIPVITTATDLENKLAVDEFAKKYNLIIENWNMAKKVSAAILEERPVGFSAFQNRKNHSFPYMEFLENEIMKAGKGALGLNKEKEINIVIDYEKNDSHNRNCLCLIPKVLVLGIGCKKDVSLEQIQSAVEKCLEEYHFYESAIGRIASIDLKKEEKGIKLFCQEKKLPFVTFSSEELLMAEGKFQASDFVAKVTGVDNVCERSAVAACNKGRLLVPKTSYQGVTVAMALDERCMMI